MGQDRQSHRTKQNNKKRKHKLESNDDPKVQDGGVEDN